MKLCAVLHALALVNANEGSICIKQIDRSLRRQERADPESLIGKKMQEWQLWEPFMEAVDNLLTFTRRPFNHVSPLGHAIYEKNFPLVQLLLDLGASVRMPDRNGDTPLHIAAQFGWPEVAEMLIRRGANKNALNRVHETPAQTALQFGHRHVSQWITEMETV